MGKKKLISMALLLLAAVAVLTAEAVSITAPHVISGGLITDEIASQFNTAIDAAAAEIETDLNSEVTDYIDQKDLARGFANAGATATHIGTQRAYNDYKAFAITLGSGFALSAPSSNPSEVEDAINNLEEEQDIYFGAAAQPFTASLGIHLKWFSEDLYGTLKFGYANIKEGTIADEFSFKSLTFGMLLNYQLLETRRLPLGFLKWRGLTVGSGVLYQSNESVFRIELGEQTATASEVSFATYKVSTDLKIDPELILSASSRSVTIPLEATTGLRVLWLLDLNIGAGIDLSFGDSDIDLSMESPVKASDNSGLDLEYTEGSVSIDAGTNGNGPQLIRPRLTAGVGLNLGPVKIDVPLMYYFDTHNHGKSAMVGVNVGIVW